MRLLLFTVILIFVIGVMILLVHFFSQMLTSVKTSYIITTNVKAIAYKRTLNACSNCLIEIKTDKTITVLTNKYTDNYAHLRISPGICVSLVNKDDMSITFYECNDYGYPIERKLTPGIYYITFPKVKSIGYEFEKSYSTWLGYVFIAIILVAFVMYAYTKWR